MKINNEHVSISKITVDVQLEFTRSIDLNFLFDLVRKLKMMVFEELYFENGVELYLFSLPKEFYYDNYTYNDFLKWLVEDKGLVPEVDRNWEFRCYNNDSEVQIYYEKNNSSILDIYYEGDKDGYESFKKYLEKLDVEG